MVWFVQLMEYIKTIYDDQDILIAEVYVIRENKIIASRVFKI